VSSRELRGSLDVGAVVRRVFGIYVDQAPVLMPAAAVVFVFTGILTAVLLAGAPGLALVAVVTSLVATTLFTGMVVELVADIQDGRRDASVGQLLKAVVPVLGQLILVGIIAGVGIVIGFIMLIVPGLILITIWSLAAPVVVLEQPGALRALGRSRELVRGNGWQVFGVILLLDVLVVFIGSAIEIAAASAGSGAGIVARVIVGVLSAPLSALAAAVLYFELRGRFAGAVAASAAPPGAPPASTDQTGDPGTGAAQAGADPVGTGPGRPDQTGEAAPSAGSAGADQTGQAGRDENGPSGAAAPGRGPDSAI